MGILGDGGLRRGSISLCGRGEGESAGGRTGGRVTER